MSVGKALLIYCMILGVITGIETVHIYMKSEMRNRDVFIGVFLEGLVVLPAIKFVIGIGVTIFLKYVLSMFGVVTENDLVYVGVFILIDLINMITIKRKAR